MRFFCCCSVLSSALEERMPRKGFQVGREGQVHRATIKTGIYRTRLLANPQMEYAPRDEENPSLGV